MSFLDKLFGDDKNQEEEKSPFDSQENFFDSQAEPSIEDIIKTNLKNVKTKINQSNFRIEDENKKLPLYYATIHKKIDVIKYLFELGSDFEDARELKGSTAFSTLLKVKDKQVLETFVEAGYKIVSGNNSAMAIATIEAPFEFIEYLIKLDVPMSSYHDGIDKFTPLEYAVMNRREFPIIEALIQAGCPLNEEDNIPFVSRIINTSLEPTTKAKTLHLLNKLNKLDLTIKDEEGNSLIKQAINAGDTKSLKELIVLGADFFEYHHYIRRMLNIKDLEDIAISIDAQDKDISEFLSLLPKSSILKYIEKQNDLSDKNIVFEIVTNARLNEQEKEELLKKAVLKNADINITPQEDKNTLYLVCKDLSLGIDICVAKFLLENGASIEYNGNSALFYAISNYNLPLIKLLLEYKAEVNFINEAKEGVINYFYKKAINLNSVTKKREVFKILLEAGLDINTKVKYEKEDMDFKDELISFFSIFCIENESRLLEHILDNNLEVRDYECIYYAIFHVYRDELLKRIIALNPTYERENYFERYGKKSNANIIALCIDFFLFDDIIFYLLETYPNMKAYNEIEPLLLKIVKDRPEYSLEVIEKLIQKDSDINRYNYYQTNKEYLNQATILAVMAFRAKDVDANHKYFKIIRLLLENGANVDLVYKFGHKDRTLVEGHSIFVQARNENRLNKELYDLFYEFGASLIKPVKEAYNETSIHSLVRFLHNDDVALEYLEYCWDKEPFDPLYKNEMNSDIITNAAMSCHNNVLKWLVNKGADVHVVGGFDNSPLLHKAISNYEFIDPLQRAQTVRTLLELGADIEQFDSDQFTPLMAASRVGAAQVVKVLLENGANVNHVNENNESAIHQALLGKYSYDLDFRFETIKSRIIKDLVDLGANLDLVINGGATALIYAIDYGYREIFDTLMDLGADVNTPCSGGYLPLYYAVLLRDKYFLNTLYKTGKLEVNKVNQFHYTVLHQLVLVDQNNKIFEDMLKSLLDMGVDINYHKEIEPPLLMYIKTMEFVGDRQVGFVSSKKKPKELEHNKVEIIIQNGADVNLCLEIAKKQNEAKDIIEYLKSLSK